MKKIYPGKTLADIFRVAFADRLWLGSMLSLGGFGVCLEKRLLCPAGQGVKVLSVRFW